MNVIELSGKATIQKAEQILEICQETLRNNPDGPIRVEWTSVTAIDASVLQILIALSRARTTEFSKPSDEVRSTLAITGLQKWLDSTTIATSSR